jgi:hypothetical protein
MMQISTANIRFDMLAFPLSVIFYIKNLGKIARPEGNKSQKSVLFFLLWVSCMFLVTLYKTSENLSGYWNIFQFGLGVIFYKLIQIKYLSFDICRIFVNSNRIVLLATIFLFFSGIRDFHLFGFTAQIVNDRNSFSGLSFERNLLAIQSLLYLITSLSVRRRSKLEFSIDSICYIFLIIVGQTRSVWISGSLVLVIYVFRRNDGKNKLKIIILLCLAFCSYVYVNKSQSNNGLVEGQFANLFNFSSGTSAYRFHIYSQAFLEIFRNWNSFLFGNGLGAFAQKHPIDVTGVQAQYISSAWVSFWHASGICGLSFFIFGLIYSYRSIISRDNAVYFFVALIVTSSATSPFLLLFPWCALSIMSQEQGFSLDSKILSKGNDHDKRLFRKSF